MIAKKDVVCARELFTASAWLNAISFCLFGLRIGRVRSLLALKQFHICSRLDNCAGFGKFTAWVLQLN
jgi:hypothetical protein